MKKEDFVTFDQAVRLKEIGYDEPCNRFYFDNGESHKTDGEFNHNKSHNVYSMPSIAAVLRWLRRKHNTIISVIGNYDCRGNLIGFEAWVQGRGRQIYKRETNDMEDYEDALEFAINKVLDYLVEKTIK